MFTALLHIWSKFYGQCGGLNVSKFLVCFLSSCRTPDKILLKSFGFMSCIYLDNNNKDVVDDDDDNNNERIAFFSLAMETKMENKAALQRRAPTVLAL